MNRIARLTAVVTLASVSALAQQEADQAWFVDEFRSADASWCAGASNRIDETSDATGSPPQELVNVLAPVLGRPAARPVGGVFGCGKVRVDEPRARHSRCG